MTDMSGAPRQEDTPSAADLLHSMEYSLVRGDIWQYRRLRGQYHQKYHVSLFQWRHFVGVEERLTRDSRISEPFCSGYFKCLVLQAARDTGLPDFWLLFWQCSQADGTAVEASHLMLREAIPDTFEAVRLLPPLLDTLLGSVPGDKLDEQWKLLVSQYAPLGLGELDLGAATPASESLGIWQVCQRLAELTRLASANTTTTVDGLQRAMAEVEATPEPTERQLQALLTWESRGEPASKHIRISIIRRLQRHPRLEASSHLTGALLTTLCDVDTGLDPMIVEAMAMRSCQLVRGDSTHLLMCIDLLHHIYNDWDGQQAKRDFRGFLRFWLQELLPRTLSPSMLRHSMAWEEIIALHVHIYGMLLPYCGDDPAIMQTYRAITENLTNCHVSPSAAPTPYEMTLMRIEAASRLQPFQDSTGYREAMEELIDMNLGTFRMSRVEELPEMVRLLVEFPWDDKRLILGTLYDDMLRALDQEMLLEQHPQVLFKIIDTLLQDLTRHGRADLSASAGRRGAFRRLLVLRARVLSRFPGCSLSPTRTHLAKRPRPIHDGDRDECGAWEDGERTGYFVDDYASSEAYTTTMAAAAHGDEGRPELKVFLSNISFQTTEANLHSFLNLHLIDCLGVQLIRDAQGQSKGVGHATFRSESAAQAALRLDRMSFEGRPLFISPYQPVPRSHRQLTISDERNPRVLFLSHLPATVTREALLSLLGLEATNATVRLIPNKHIAYVECPTEAVASNCARTHDGARLGGTTIRVQISDPQTARTRAAALNMVPRGVRSVRGGRLQT